MADSTATRNDKARARARGRGQQTYRHEVIDHWPACVDCALPIRFPAEGRIMARRCGCEGVVWTLRLGSIAEPDRWVKG